MKISIYVLAVCSLIALFLSHDAAFEWYIIWKPSWGRANAFLAVPGMIYIFGALLSFVTEILALVNLIIQKEKTSAFRLFSAVTALLTTYVFAFFVV